MSTTAKVLVNACTDCSCSAPEAQGIFVLHDGYPSCAGTAIIAALADTSSGLVNSIEDAINRGGASTETASRQTVAEQPTDWTYSVCRDSSGIFKLVQVRDSAGRVLDGRHTEYGVWFTENVSPVLVSEGFAPDTQAPLTVNPTMPTGSVTPEQWA
jgi:hypothetical protein